MTRSSLTAKEAKATEECIEHFLELRHLLSGFLKSLQDRFVEDDELNPFIHFIKHRIKSADRLRAKVERKQLGQSRGSTPLIQPDNLFEHVNDCGGIRILHLHTSQLEEMCPHIHRVIQSMGHEVIEGPIAKCWDNEYESIYQQMGIEPESQQSMYSSVHYVIQANKRTKITFELQVRTLMEEVWGEVSHLVSYELDEPIPEVVDQLGVLARMTSGSTRLVDCIFKRYSAAVADSDAT